MPDVEAHFLPITCFESLFSVMMNKRVGTVSYLIDLSSVQLLSCVQHFATPWTAACHASLSFTICQACSTHFHQVGDAIQPSHLLLSPSPPFPASGSFPMSQFFTSGSQSIGVSASSVLPMNTQNRSPLEWTGLISLQSKGLSRVFFNTTVQKHQFFGAQLSLQPNSHIHT